MISFIVIRLIGNKFLFYERQLKYFYYLCIDIMYGIMYCSKSPLKIRKTLIINNPIADTTGGGRSGWKLLAVMF